MLAFPLKALDRRHKSPVLKLLAQVAQAKPLPPEPAEFPALLHRQLWPGHTPSDELSERQEVDDAFRQTGYQNP